MCDFVVRAFQPEPIAGDCDRGCGGGEAVRFLRLCGCEAAFCVVVVIELWRVCVPEFVFWGGRLGWL